MNVTLPNGVTIQGVPENATKDQIRQKAISAGLAKAEDFPDSKPEKRSFGQETSRALGRGARYAIEGASAIPGMLVDSVLNTKVPIGSDKGLELVSVGELGNRASSVLGGPSDIFAPSTQGTVSERLTASGLPEDVTASERVVGDVGRALTSGGGLLRLAQRSTGPIASAFSQAPGLQAIGEAGGASAAGVARESDVGPGGQLAAGLLGGIVAPTTALAGGKAIQTGGRALKSGKDTLKQLMGNRTPGMVDEFAGNQIPREGERRLRSAQRLGEQITPAEAIGDPILAARQGALGTSEQGARQLVDFGEERIAKQGDKIQGFLNTLSPNETSAAAPIRGTARKIIKEQQDALSKQAAPLYKKAFESSLDDDTARAMLADPLIGKYAKQVRSDPLFERELGSISSPTEKINYITGITGEYKKFPMDGNIKNIRFWDMVKRQMDDDIEASVRSGERNKSRLLEGSKSKLVSALDEASPDYVAARAIYGEGARPLQQLREGVVGRVAGLEDNQLKRVSKILFDTTETDPKVLNQVRQQFIKENPDAWRGVIRNEIERRLDSVKGDRSGSTFYNAILSKDRDFRMFLNATRGLPETQRALIDMRRVWKDLINPESVKGAAGKAKSSLDVPRSSVEALANYVKNRLGGQADSAAVKLITDPDWADEVRKISAIKNQSRREQTLLEAIIQVAESTKPLTTGATIGTVGAME